MQNLEKIGRELERSGQADAIKKLAASADGQKLGQMIDRQALEKAAKSGDAESLKRMMGQVLATEEGKRLAENVRKMLGK